MTFFLLFILILSSLAYDLLTTSVDTTLNVFAAALIGLNTLDWYFFF